MDCRDPEHMDVLIQITVCPINREKIKKVAALVRTQEIKIRSS
jgi:hypothetical protein